MQGKSNLVSVNYMPPWAALDNCWCCFCWFVLNETVSQQWSTNSLKQQQWVSNRHVCLKAACLSYHNLQTKLVNMSVCNSLMSHYIISGYLNFQTVTSHYHLEMPVYEFASRAYFLPENMVHFSECYFVWVVNWTKHFREYFAVIRLHTGFTLSTTVHVPLLLSAVKDLDMQTVMWITYSKRSTSTRCSNVLKLKSWLKDIKLSH